VLNLANQQTRLYVLNGGGRKTSEGYFQRANSKVLGLHFLILSLDKPVQRWFNGRSKISGWG